MTINKALTGAHKNMNALAIWTPIPMLKKLLILCPLIWSAAYAGPWVESGDMGLRHDIQVLADAGLITGAVTNWPLAWGDLVTNLDETADLEPYEWAALARVNTAARKQTRDGIIQLHSRVSVAENPIQIRSYANTPREDIEVEFGGSWTGERFAVNAQGTWVDDPLDGDDFRLDGSYAGVALGNWSLAAIPSLTIERISTAPFETKWLSWIGPWDFTFLLGQLEDNVKPADALFMGMRFNFRPLKSLEIGISRTAQLCGTSNTFDDDGELIESKKRQCNLNTFWNLMKGRDNGGENIERNKEPGNQLAGYDLRWSFNVFKQPLAFYTQWIGEDSNALLPTQMMGLFGLEAWGQGGELGTYRTFFEWADTECDFDFYRGSGGSPNLCYNNVIFREGYRYEGRSIGSSYDNDSSVFTLGTIFIDNSDAVWTARINAGNLNRTDQGQRDPDVVRNTVAKEKTKYREITVDYSRDTRFGKIKVGVGYDDRKATVSGSNTTDFEGYLEWSMSTF
jgi:hypothetical protein